jgi:cation-transporting ATPase I
VWVRREPELAGRRHDLPVSAIRSEPRPVPLPQGPVERYADLAALGSLGGFALGLVATRSPRRAANALMVGIPRASSLGREVFAAHLGRELARRDVLVVDPAVLRRLDRVDTVVLDRRVMTTGRWALAEVSPLGEEDREAVAAGAARALDPDLPDEPSAADGWRLVPFGTPGLRAPRGAPELGRRLARGGRRVRALTHHDEVVGVAALVPEIHPLASAVASAARAVGHQVVVAGRRGALAERVGAERTVAAGRELAGAVRTLQGEGRAVLLVSGGDAHRALRAADCGVGLTEVGARAPWGAHVIAARGLEDAWFMVEASARARRTSQVSAWLSLTGAGVGGLGAMLGPSAGSGARATLPVQVAALAAEASAMATALSLGQRRAPRPATAAPWHSMSLEAVLSALGTGADGLGSAEVAARRPAAPPATPLPLRVTRAVVGELANPLTPLLALGAGLSAAVGSATDAALVAGTLVANGAISGAQRVMTERSIERLFRSSTMPVTVVRGGARTEVPADRLVPGDVMEVAAGKVVPADGRIIELDDLEVDEAVVTGESVPVAKRAGPTPGAEVAERSGMLYDGTTVVSGSARAVVVAVGGDTESGRALADAPEPPPSGVETRLAGLTRAVLPASVLGGALVTGLGFLRHRPLRESVGTGVSLMVGAVPEGLPLLATVAQLSAAQRLSRRNALVRNPPTIEALALIIHEAA